MSHRRYITNVFLIILLITVSVAAGAYLGQQLGMDFQLFPDNAKDKDHTAETRRDALDRSPLTDKAPAGESAHPASYGGHADDRHGEKPATSETGGNHDAAESALRKNHAKETEHGHEAGVKGAEPSDLDRPVEEMWAARCEHDIPQYQCDECRYELGAVKLAPGLFGDGGLVRAGTPVRQSLGEERSLPGEVRMDETRTVHVASPLAGIVTRGFTAPGRSVEAGASLFEVDSPEVAEAKSALMKALATLTLARKTAEREALLFSKKIVAEVEVREAEAKRTEAETEVAAVRGRLLRLGLSKQELQTIAASPPVAIHGLVTIRAPRAGVVMEGHAAPGEYVEPGKEILTLSELGAVWIMADLREEELTTLSGATGLRAEVQALGRTFPGILDLISAQVSEETRTAKARISVENTGGMLRPGMFVTVRLQFPGHGETLAVPKVAVLAAEGRTFVFVHKENDFWIRRPVTLGKRFDGMVAVVSGLEPESRIITDGSFLLKSDVLRSKMGAGCAD